MSALVLLALWVLILCLTAQPAFGSGFDGEIDVVLLGDSYSAGNGAGDYWSDDECRRAWNNWAELYLDLLRDDGFEVAPLDNQACNESVTGHIAGQAAASITEDTDLVLLTIGGNDVNFVGVIISCFASRHYAPGQTLIWGDPSSWLCASYIERAKELATDGQLAQDVASALTGLPAAGLREDARVVLLSYPYLESGGDYFHLYPSWRGDPNAR